MMERQPIAENLISCRNILLGGRKNDHVIPCLEEVIRDTNLIAVAPTKAIVEACAKEVINQVLQGHYMSAGLILNLIHNLPLDQVSEQKWDLDYFLSMEFPSFLKKFDKIISARKIALIVSHQLGKAYLGTAE